MRTMKKYIDLPMAGGDPAKIEEHGRVKWVHCPYCDKRMFPLNEKTSREFYYQCDRCRKLFEVLK